MIKKIFIFMAAAVIFTTGAVYAATVDLPKTGQTTCYDTSGNAIVCTGTGQDGELLKGVAWPNPRFTTNSDTTVTDNLTGLVWTADGNAPVGTTGCSGVTSVTWQGALDYAACLNNNNYLGHTDWRLPNINELESLVHAGEINSATWLNTQGFSNVQTGYYWSSTTSADYTTDGWFVLMLTGFVGSRGKANYHYVWPVRSGQ